MKTYFKTPLLGSLDLLGLHYQTALLEAVGWDESLRDELVKYVTEYLNAQEEAHIDDITILLLNVEDSWGFQAKEVLKSIFSIEAVCFNLNTQGSQDVH